MIDDNPSKRGRWIEGVQIVGNRHDIVSMAEKYHITRIVYAIPSNSMEDQKAILNLCKETTCKLQIIPGMYQLLNDEVSVSKLRDVEIADLLGREQVRVNNEGDPCGDLRQDGHGHGRRRLDRQRAFAYRSRAPSRSC